HGVVAGDLETCRAQAQRGELIDARGSNLDSKDGNGARLCYVLRRDFAPLRQVLRWRVGWWVAKNTNL
ncbi:MAG: hypothetical protein KGL29_12945, partial [Alphaproteobacteria bacterium]|nr:hypothetical protein [Alphaproteobacteria bacterium]